MDRLTIAVEAPEHRAECACLICEAARFEAELCAELPETADADRDEASTGLAEEAEESALLADGWQPIDLLRTLWRDPQTRRVERRRDALELHLADCGVL